MVDDILDAIRDGVIKGLDLLGRLRLDQNNGVALPYANVPDEVSGHIADVTGNPHAVTDAQVHSGVGGTINFTDYDDFPHTITIVNGRITSWVIDTDEQLS